ncbi:hypothetical protein AB205_0063770 [Aquarana catesbeiana]|uniref:Uncharacterized protein n=1 Tax=Aquarana catesbeiana TaxID=8400 RepID=A0A2G9RLY5_AQUCT|nr:hypothetical protein AB205_0063770 [Aquarana catesbeiana]
MSLPEQLNKESATQELRGTSFTKGTGWGQDEVLLSGDREEKQADYSSAQETTFDDVASQSEVQILTEMVRYAFMLPLTVS